MLSDSYTVSSLVQITALFTRQKIIIIIFDSCHSWNGKLYLGVRKADGSTDKLNQLLDVKCKIYTRIALWYHWEMNRAGGQITCDKSKVAASNLEGTWYERELLRPVAHLSMAQAQYEMSAWGLQTAWWTRIIEVKFPFLIMAAQCPLAVRYEPLFFFFTLRSVLYKIAFHLMEHNGAIWHCATQRFSNNFFVTKLPTPGITALTASVFTLRVMNDSQSAVAPFPAQSFAL